MTITFNEYRAFDAMGLAQALRRRDVSRKEVLDAALSRLQAVNPQVNAVTYLHQPALDQTPGESQGAFAGVPYLIKDLHAPVAGMPLTHGSCCSRATRTTSTAKPWPACGARVL